LADKSSQFDVATIGRFGACLTDLVTGQMSKCSISSGVFCYQEGDGIRSGLKDDER